MSALPKKSNPTLIVIAGPNGSGKSTIVSALQEIGSFGVLVNADQIAASLAKRKSEAAASPETQWEAAIAAEEMRWSLLAQRVSFATETVMSDKPRWIRFISAAKTQGYRVLLYFITTQDPRINVLRVRERILAGGHAVPEDKIVSRYRKVMGEVLPEAIRIVDEAVLFDNSSPEDGAIGVLRLENGTLFPLVARERMPKWAARLVYEI